MLTHTCVLPLISICGRWSTFYGTETMFVVVSYQFLLSRQRILVDLYRCVNKPYTTLYHPVVGCLVRAGLSDGSCTSLPGCLVKAGRSNGTYTIGPRCLVKAGLSTGIST